MDRELPLNYAINSFQANASFLYPLKTSKKPMIFLMFFRGYRKWPVIWNGITWFMDVSLCYQILYHTFRGIINKCNNNANLTCYNHFEGTDLPLNTHQPFLRLPISHLLSAFCKSHSPFKKGVKIKRDLFEATGVL